jgi:hypothetical protein
MGAFEAYEGAVLDAIPIDIIAGGGSHNCLSGAAGTQRDWTLIISISNFCFDANVSTYILVSVCAYAEDTMLVLNNEILILYR